MANEKLARAQKLERKAKRLEKESSKYLIGPTQGEVARIYEKAADAWYRLGEYRQALKDFELAAKYVYDEDLRRKIRKKMDEIYRIEGKYRKGPGKFGKLEKRLVYAILSIISLFGALLFVSVNLTGNVTALTARDSNLMGILLFVFGLFFAFLFFKKKNKF